MAELETTDNSTQTATTNAAVSNNTRKKLPFGLDTKNLIMVGIAVVTALVLIYQLFLAPKYSVLYSELEQSDAAAISAYLEKSGVKFKISPDGGSISVSGSPVPKLRLDLANKGLPKGNGVGFEIFDKTTLNLSDFNQKINYTRALEGELSRTISSLESIKSAKVHLALANKSVFKEQNQTAKASVIITTEFGQSLTDEQVKGIQHLVSSAIQDLDPANVQITDHEGNSLVKFQDANSMKQEALLGNEKKIRDYESKLETDLLNMLDPILGKGNVLVNVSTEMDFDEAEVNIEKFNPLDKEGKEAQPVVRSEKVISEKYSKQNQKTFGTAGDQNELPGFVQGSDKKQDAKADGRDYIKEDKTTNYEVSKSIERIKRATGNVKKISVAVVVNKDIDASERSTLRQTVQVAAGLNLERGDQVIVTGIRFSSTPYTDISKQKIEKEFSEMDQIAKMKKYLSLALMVAFGIVILMVVMMSLNAGIDDKRAKEIEDILREDDIPLLSTIDEKIQEAEEAYHRQLSMDSNRSITHMKNTISTMAVQDPKTIARALQAYIMD